MSIEVERGRGPRARGNRDRSREVESVGRRAVRRGASDEEGVLAADGPLACRTASTPAARPTTSSSSASRRAKRNVAWGKVNRPMDPAQFDALHRDFLASLKGKELYVLDAFAGADPRIACRFASSPSTPGTTCSAATCSSTIPAAARRTRRSSRSSIRRASRPIRRGTARTRRSSSPSISRRSSCSSAARATPAR